MSDSLDCEKIPPLSKLKSRVRIGPAGWSYPDWKGKVYPVKKPRGFHEVAYLAGFFDTVEINSSFYSSPRAEPARGWLRQVEHNPRFMFTAKLLHRFTHERNASVEDERGFKEGIRPIAEDGRLGALLLQFPWSFKNAPENREYLAALCRQFGGYPLVVEVRHSSWEQPEVLEMLGEMGVGLSNIDQPVIGRSIAPGEHVTAPLGYVRLHGRNYRNWFRNGKPEERYDYLYTLKELEPWAARVKRIMDSASTVYVIANNHFEAKGLVNALELMAMIFETRVRAPGLLVENYPQLRDVAIEEKMTASENSLLDNPLL
ncbi:MAG: DUF72 domain-containing protein [Terriglobia bacterium]